MRKQGNHVIGDNFIAFSSRAERQGFVLKEFKDIFEVSRSVLDVGCDENLLKHELGEKVFGIDIGGNPDLLVDLEKQRLSYFDSDSKDFVICLEVLEHLDNLHEVLFDLFRVSSKYVLISLPNSLNLRKMIKMVRTNRSGKFYGLPPSKPVDRHKWFFSYREIIDFVLGLDLDSGWGVKEILLHYHVLYKNRSFFSLIKQYFLISIVRLFKLRSLSKDVFVLFEKKV